LKGNAMTAVTLIDRFVPRSIPADVAIITGGAVLTAIAAQVQIPMFPVPMTLQTFSVLLVAAALGAGRASLSMALYMAMGGIGLPVFAGAKTLTGVLPTAGYLVGFVAAAAVIGFLASKGFSKNPLKLAFSFALGSVIIYALGVSGLMLSLGLTLEQALAAGVIPFIIGDVVKAVMAALALPLAWKLLK
jgi:biotin transport system substrate-specific component